MRDLIIRLWNSPTVTTWASLGTQSLSLLAVLPLILTRLSEQEIALYYLFASVISLQGLFMIGFQPTFTRLVGYAHGGCSVNEMEDFRERDRGAGRDGGVNESSLISICSSMRWMYRCLAIAALVLLGFGGSLLMARPISLTERVDAGWLAWAIIVAVFGFRILCAGFDSYLRGANYVALSNRWQTLFNLGSILSSLLALCLAPSLLLLVAVNQLWSVMNMLRSWRLCQFVSEGRFAGWSRERVDPQALRIAWPRALRSGLGFLGSKATQQSLGFVYAQSAASGVVASYLLGMKLVAVLEQFSMAPFYSKVPLLNRLRSSGDLDQLHRVARRGMALGHWVYFIGFTGLAVCGDALLGLIGANAPFPQPALWYLLGIAFFFQRFGGNHIQLYSTTNHIIWHWANGIQGVVIILGAVILGPRYGGLGFAGAILAGNFIYACFTAAFSYRILPGSALRFELKTSIVPALLLALFAYAEWRFALSSAASQAVLYFTSTN